MLKINIGNMFLAFADLSAEQLEKLQSLYKLHKKDKKWYIMGDPGELYKVLLTLSYDYDIELI